jgi:Tfp pilus assembly protein PilX
MKTLPKLNFANLRCRLMPASGGMSTKHAPRNMSMHSLKQRGVVLFLTLLALLAMSLAAVALIRSVDTNAMIAGNLAFKQLATNAGSAEIERAITLLANMQIANNALDVGTNPGNTFNTDPPSTGYFSFIDDRDVTDPGQFNWEANSSLEWTDLGGNRRSYIIQRMCRDDATPIGGTVCLYGDDAQDNGSSKGTTEPGDICLDCSNVTAFPEYRITVRTIGLKNSISYVQAFAY